MATEADVGILITKIITVFSIVVSCPIYLLVLFVIWRNSHKVPLNSSFFTLYIALGLVDVVVYNVFNACKLAYWNLEWGLFEPYNQPNIICKILIFFNWWLAYMQFHLTILSCLNRLISIVWSGLYRQYWTNRTTRIILLSTLLISMCLAFPIWFVDVTVLQFTTTVNGTKKVYTVGPTFAKTDVQKIYLLSWKVHIYAILAICTVCYTIMFIKVKEIRAASKTLSMRRELRLLYPMTVLYVCNILYVVFFAFNDYWAATDNKYARNAQWIIYIASDAYDLNNGYVMMFTSAEVRHAVLEFLGFRFKAKTCAVVSISHGGITK